MSEVVPEEQAEPAPARLPVVRVPVGPARNHIGEREYVEAPLDVATQWDERIWRQA